MTVEQKLNQIIRPIVERMNLILLDVKIKGDRKNPVYQVYADNEKGITLGECEELTRAIQDEIDLNDQFQGNYRLDVSSPGIGHPLKYDFEFKKNIGRTLAVQETVDEEHISHEGVLQEFDDDSLVLKTKDGQLRIDRARIGQAKVKVQW